MRKSLICIGILCYAIGFSNLSCYGQQENLVTQFSNSMVMYNPGFAGTRDTFCITGIARSQWAGFTQNNRGAYETQTLIYQTPLKFQGMGIAGSITNSRIFPFQSLTATLDLSSTIKLSYKEELSFGLKASIKNVRALMNTLDLNNTQQQDPAFHDNLYSSRFLYNNIGAGVLYKRKNYFSAISVTNLRSLTIFSSSDMLASQQHYYWLNGIKKELSPKLNLNVTSLLKVTYGAPIQFDLQGVLIYNEVFSIGTTMRSRDAISLLSSIQISPNLKFGYSYDYSYASYLRFQNGSHEVMIQFYPKRRVVTHTPKFQTAPAHHY